MATLISACLGALLAWLVASDNKLPWLSSSSGTTVSPKENSQARKQTTNKGTSAKATLAPENLQGFVRLAVYVAIIALLWLSTLDFHAQQSHLDSHVRPAEPSSRVDADPRSLLYQSGGPSSDADRTAPEESQTMDGQGSSPLDEELREAAHVAAVRNATLGFEKIFVVNLPERTDKRDALTLVSTLTDIQLTWTSALRGTNVPDKALPLGVDRKGWRDGGIGSWRSQMNVIRT